MKDINLLMAILFSACHIAIAQNVTYSMQEPIGYCYNMYSYCGQNYRVCYRETVMGKCQFHFSTANRRFIMLYSKRHSANGYDYRTLLYDTKGNAVCEMDSCKNNPLSDYPRFLGTDGDRLYVSHCNSYSINDRNVPSSVSIVAVEDVEYGILKIVASLSNIGTWCVSHSKDKLVYSEMHTNKISLVCQQDTVPKVIGVGEVIAWKDDKHLLYTETTVEGYGDLYYNLCEYSVTDNRSRLVAKHLNNVYDYHGGILVYEKAPRIVCLAKLDSGIVSDFVELDFKDFFNYIYSVYILNSAELVIGGDRPNFDSFYYKCSIVSNRHNCEE